MNADSRKPEQERLAVGDVALKFGKTEGEIWTERLVAAGLTLLILFLHSALFFTVVSKWPRGPAACACVLQTWIAWQGVSKTVTGGLFRPRLYPENAGSARDVCDVVVTCLFLVNLAFFLFIALDR
jgi:hypothetical protein